MKRSEYFSLAKRLRIAIPALLTSIIILSCSWDPIFYNISMEQAPRRATITGSPQNMVITRDSLYVWTLRGSNIWRFENSGDADSWQWNRITSPGHPIGGLAAVEFDNGEYHLYAVVYPGGSPANSRIMRYNDYEWVHVPMGDNIENLYSIGHLHSAGGQLFARAQLTSNLVTYAILRFVPDPSSGDFATKGALDVPRTDSHINLRGVAERNSNIYLATARAGIFRVDEASDVLTPFTPASDFDITGIIETGGDIVVVGNSSTGGVVHVLRGAGASWDDEPRTFGVFFNGGMSVWREFYPAFTDAANPHNDGWRPRLLLLGVRTNSHNVNGYREIVLDPATGNVDTSSSPFINNPGILDFSSVRNNSIYRASIGTRSVRFIQQVPNLGGIFYPALKYMESEFYGWQPPIFASTSRDGLWAYNFRNDRWNADDNIIAWRAPTSAPGE